MFPSAILPDGHVDGAGAVLGPGWGTQSHSFIEIVRTMQLKNPVCHLLLPRADKRLGS